MIRTENSSDSSYFPPCYFCKQPIKGGGVSNMYGPNFSQFPVGHDAHTECYLKPSFFPGHIFIIEADEEKETQKKVRKACCTLF